MYGTGLAVLGSQRSTQSLISRQGLHMTYKMQFSQQLSEISAIDIAICQVKKQKNTEVRKSTPCFMADELLSWGANPSLSYCKDFMLTPEIDGSWNHQSSRNQ